MTKNLIHQKLLSKIKLKQFLVFLFCMVELIADYNNFFEHLPFLQVVLLSVFGGIYLLRFFYDLFFYGRVAFSKNTQTKSSESGISVLMVVRNEEDNIRNNLPLLLSSEYKDFEIVVVDDYSQDQTYTVLGLLSHKYKKMRLSSLNQDIKYSSKQAMNIALKAAKNNWVLIMKPSTSEIPDAFLQSFAEKMQGDKNLIVGYSNIISDRGFFNLLFRIESFFQQFQSFAYIKARLGYVVNEENIAFKKQKYFDMGGFAREIADEFANLELLVNKFIKRKQTMLQLSPEVVVRKKRHVNSKKYKDLKIKFFRIRKKLNLVIRIFLFIDECTALLIVPITIAVFFLFKELIIWFVVVVILKVIIHAFILCKVLNRLNEQKIFISSLIYELIVPWFGLFLKWSYFSSLRKK